MISDIFIKRQRLAYVIAIIISFCGYLSFKSLPVSQFPDIASPSVSVNASYPGADAKSVSQSIAQVIEPAINGTDHMISMRSVSGSDGSYSLNITFESGSDPQLNAVNITNKVDRVKSTLPSEVQKSVTVGQGSGSMLQVIAFYSPDGSRDPLFLSNFAKLNVLDDISRVPGVASATMFGGVDYAMRIWVDYNKLNGLKLTVSDIVQAINSQNSQASLGKVGAEPLTATTDLQINLVTNGKLVDVNQFKNIVIRAETKGSFVRLSDVARVEIGPKSQDTIAKFNGKPSTGISVFLVANANAINVAHNVKKIIDNLQPRLPQGVKTEIMYDTSVFVEKMFDSVKETLLEAFLLSALVVILFLGSIKSALIPIISIPVSLLGSLIIVYLLGFSLNTISLLALVLAIGIVVDDAIVVVENVTHVMEKNPELKPAEATKLAMQQITAPIIAITLVLLSVFIPSLFMPGITGKLFTQFAVVVCSSMLFSALNALTLSPALCSLLLTPNLSKEKKPNLFLRKFAFVEIFYSRIGAYFANNIRLSCLIIIFFALGAIFLNNYVPKGFMPDEDQGAFMGEVTLPDASSLSRTNKIVNQVDANLLKQVWTKGVFSVSGQSIMQSLQLSNKGFFIVLMKPFEQRKSFDQSVFSAVNQIGSAYLSFTEAQIIPFNIPAMPTGSQSSGLSFELQSVSGGEQDEFVAVARGLMNSANGDKRLASVFLGSGQSTKEVLVEVDREKARVVGVDISDIYATLQANLNGQYVNDFNYMGRSWQVIIQGEADVRTKIDDIYKLNVRSKNGDMISLTNLLTTTIISAPMSLTRYNNLSSISMNVNPAPGKSTGEAIAAIEEIATKSLPKNYKIEWTGSALQEKTAASQTTFVILMALFFSYLCLVALYESWLIPISVLIGLTSGLFGAVTALLLLGVANDIYAKIGIVVLIALAAKNAILIVEVAVEKISEGENFVEAAVMAANQRFRAIMMTSFAFILGILPLVIAHGPGANTERSVSTAVFGGMLAATLIGVLLIPPLFIVTNIVPNKLSKLIANPQELTKWISITYFKQGKPPGN